MTGGLKLITFFAWMDRLRQPNTFQTRQSYLINYKLSNCVGYSQFHFSVLVI